MKTIRLFLFMALSIPVFPAAAFPPPDDIGGLTESEEGPPFPPPPPPGEGGAFHRRGRGEGPRPEFPGRRFHRELGELGKKVRANRALIRELEESVFGMSEGPEKAALDARLEKARAEGARLRLELADRKVEITGKALESAQLRYRQACEDVLAVREWLAEKYPQILEEKNDDAGVGD